MNAVGGESVAGAPRRDTRLSVHWRLAARAEVERVQEFGEEAVAAAVERCRRRVEAAAAAPGADLAASIAAPM